MEKFGQPMDIIHAPVPFYKEQIQTTVDNFFNLMSCDEYMLGGIGLYTTTHLYVMMVQESRVK